MKTHKKQKNIIYIYIYKHIGIPTLLNIPTPTPAPDGATRKSEEHGPQRFRDCFGMFYPLFVRAPRTDP